MGIAVTPAYSDLFEDKPTFTDLIADIPTRIIIIFCALINAELYNNDFKPDKQAEIFHFISKRFPIEQRKYLVSKIAAFYKDKQHVTILIFAKRYTIELIHRALQKPKEIELADTTPDQEFRLFKAYLLIVDELNQELETILFNGLQETFPRLGHRQFIWPLYVHQNEVNHSVNPHFQSLKLIAFLKYLTEHPVYNKYLTNYLAHIQENSALTYIYNLLSFLRNSHKNQKDHSFIKQFAFIRPDKPSTLLKSMAMNMEAYASNLKLHINYKGLKEKPIFEYQPNTYAAFSYDLLYNKVYNGFLFDFYNNSGLDKEFGHKSFADFKSRYGKEFSEAQLFRTFIKKMFNKKHTVIGFGDNDGYPDCYIRISNIIYLLEFKDYFFADDIVVKAKYDLIKKDINLKFIGNQEGKAKGITQLSNQIAFLETGCFDFDNFSDRNLKRQNVTIYPIIVHTNHIFTIPDVNDYLNEEFRKMVKPCSFKVKDVVLIELETIFRFLQHFMQDRNAFKNSLDKYLSIKKNRIKKFNAQPHADNFVNAYCSYEMAIPKLDLKPHSLSDLGFIKAMFDALEVKRTN